MATPNEADVTLGRLKKFLVTGNNSSECYGVHIIRDVVNWYQGFERSQHKGQGMQLPKTTDPIEMLLDSSVIPKLVEEGKADTIIDTLRSYNQLSCVDKEALVLCLAVASKQSDQKKLVTDAHSAVRELCTNTHLFFLFIHFSKMISKKSGHSGWGRGLRRAVSEWYLSWEPQRLALEVTRHSSAHGWTHRDVIRLAHLKLKDMPLGTQVVLHYVFLGLEKTKDKYTGQDNTSELLELLQALDRHPHSSTPQAGEPTWDNDQVISKADKVHDQFGGLSLHDVPSQSLKSQEVWSHVLDKLEAKCVVASVNRLARGNFLNPSNELGHTLQAKLVDRLSQEDVAASATTPAQVLMTLHAYEHPTRFIAVGAVKGQDKRAKGGATKVPRAPGKVSSRRTTKTNPKVVEALHALLAASAKNIEKTTHRLGIFVDVRATMGTSHVWTGNPVGKGEVTGHEGAAATVLSLASGGTNPAATTLAFSGTTFSELKLTEGITLPQLIDKFKETVIGEVNIERALKWAHEHQAETVVVLTHRLEQSVITAATEGLQRHNETNKTQTRLVLCGLCSRHLSVPHTNNLLVVLGFQQRTPTVIRAFHERYF
ncbi:hypothetical protein O3P69_015974 [Scylla paramamosain]|uniref:TROVE domain-containing protein n=1 Tax=Scylla paramamosain TaxID=85552 RepID=A0AAW0T8G2_SCYPA